MAVIKISIFKYRVLRIIIIALIAVKILFLFTPKTGVAINHFF